MSPRGMEGVRAASADIEARRSGGGGQFTPKFVLAEGDVAHVRFLEQGEDVHWCWMHEGNPKPRAGGKSWGDQFPCLDQDQDGTTACPGCEDGRSKKFKGFINVLWREAPKWKTDAKGDIVKDGAGKWVQDGTAPRVVVWEGGIKVFEMLDEKDATYKGLTTRDFTVKTRGTGFDKKWFVEPVVDDNGETKATAMSAADQALASNKFDLNNFTQPHSYEETKRLLAGEAEKDVLGGGGDGAVKRADVGRINVFLGAEE